MKNPPQSAQPVQPLNFKNAAVIAALLLIILFGVIRGWWAFSGSPVYLDQTSAKTVLRMAYEARDTPYPIIPTVKTIDANAVTRAAGWFHAAKSRFAKSSPESDALFFLFICAAALAVPAYLLSRIAGVSEKWALFGAALTAMSPMIMRAGVDTGRFAEEIPVSLVSASALWFWCKAVSGPRSSSAAAHAILAGALLGAICGIPHARVCVGVFGLLGFFHHYDHLADDPGAYRSFTRPFLWMAAGFAAGLLVSGCAPADILSPALAPWYASLGYAAVASAVTRSSEQGKPLDQTRFAALFINYLLWAALLLALAAAWKSRDWVVFRQYVLRPLYPAYFKYDRGSLWNMDRFLDAVKLRELIGPGGLACSLWLVVAFWNWDRSKRSKHGIERRLISRWGWMITALSLAASGYFRVSMAVWVSVVCATVMDDRWRSVESHGSPISNDANAKQRPSPLPIVLMIAAALALHWTVSDPLQLTKLYSQRNADSAEIQKFFRRMSLQLPGDAVLWCEWRDGYWLQRLTGLPTRLYDRRSDPEMFERIQTEMKLLNSDAIGDWIKRLKESGVTHVVLNDHSLDPGMRSRMKRGESGYQQSPKAIRLLDQEAGIKPMARFGYYRLYQLTEKD